MEDSGARIEKDPNFNSPYYVPVTKQTLEEAKSRYKNNKRRQRQLKDGRTLSKISFFSNLEDLEEEESGGLVPNPAMEQGKPIPDDLGPFPKRLLGKPVDEIDRARKTDQTFIVVAKRFGGTNILRFSNSNSLWYLSPLNPVRRFMIRVLSHQIFDILVIATILVNCVFMALDQPFTTYWLDIDPRKVVPPTPQPPSRLYLDVAEYTFTAIYVTEMVVKITSRGFIWNKFTYLRDPWNWLDFAVIILAFVTFALQFARVDAGNFAVIRSFRVLRALKTISIVPGLKSIINALVGSMKMLFEVILLTFFVLLIFSLLALQLFMGSLLQKCVLNLDITDLNETEEYWHEHTQNSSNWIFDGDGQPLVCSNVSIFGQTWSGCNNPNYTCLPNIGDNPNDGYTNFDNIGWAMVTSFQLITLDYWENVYNLIIRAQGPLAIVFFLLTCMLGSFYLINLMLAVVAMAYTEEMENIGKEKEKKKKTKDSVMDYDATKLKSLAEKKRKRKEKKKKQKEEKAGQIASKSDVKEADTVVGSMTSITTNSSKISNVDDGLEIIQAAYEEKPNNKKGNTSSDTLSSGTNDKSNSFEDTTDSTSKLPVIGENDNGGKVECCPTFCCKGCRRCCLCPSSVHKVWLKIQFVCQWIVLDPLMDLFITVIILLNTLFLSLDHYQIDATFDLILTVGNTICTVIFTFECVMKLCALGYTYFRNNWNNFDLFIVVTSLIELPLANLQGLSVLRTFRLLRVLKLAQSWTTMRVLLSIIFSALGAVANVSVVLVIIVYIFAIIGMQLFGANYIPENFEDGIVPRWNFVDFPHSVMLIFRILCGEWIEPLYQCMNCSNAGLCIAVFISTLTVGNILILNLFLALLLNSFASDSLKKEEEESRLGLAFAKLKRYFLKVICICCCCLPKRYRNKVSDSNQDIKEEAPVEKAKEATENNVMARTEAFVVVSDANGHHDTDQALTNGGFENHDEETANSEQTWADNHLKVFQNGSVPNGNLPHVHTNGTVQNGSVHSLKENGTPRPVSVALSTSKNAETGEIETCGSHDRKSIKNLDGQETDKKASANGEATPVPPIDASDEVPVEDPVQPCCPGPISRWCSKKCPCPFCKPPEETKIAKVWRQIREFVCTVVEHRVFEGIILVCILISSVTLVFDDIYLDEKPIFKEILSVTNYVFVGIFFFEMILKWIGLGFKVYFTSFWCLLDFFIVMVSLASVGVQLIGLGEIGAFRSLRTLRALRPLRAISRWQGMKIVVNALAFAIPSIGNVLLVCMMFWLIFAIIGVQLFRGTFYRCVDDNGDIVKVSDVNNITDCLDLGYSWENSKIHFDNVYFAIIALFQVATFEGWMEVMESAVDNRGVNMQPSREESFTSYGFFLIFIILGSFFFLNLFIGVIIDNFNTLKRKYEGDRTLDVFMTSNQKNYYQTMRKLGNKKPKKQIKAPTARNKVLSFCYKLTTSTKFEIAIVVVILLNMLAMMVEHHNMQEPLVSILDGINIVFTVIFVFEAILKILALRWYYFKSPWNVFDFIVVIFSVLGIIASDLLSAFINPTLLRVFRLLRIGRILRLVKSAKGLRKLLFALVISLPALFNIGCLLFLVIFIYAIIGMSQFSRVKIQGALDDTVNFQTWTKSMLLLYRVSTSAGWNDILDALMLDGPPDCDPEYGGYPNGDCGSTVFAMIFFITFIVLSFLIIINTYIAVILENFSAAHAQEEVGITEDDFGMFYQVWEKYDPNATQFIPLEQLSEFCDDLEMPLRLAKPNQIKLAGLDLPIYYDTKLHCIDVLFALTKRVLGDVEESEDFSELQKQMSEQFLEAFPDLGGIKPTTTTMQLNKRNTAAKRLQRAWRLHVLKRELAKAVAANRNKGSNTTSRVASARSSLVPEGDKESTKLDTSFNGSSGNDLQVPGNMVGISRATTPVIPEVDAEDADNAKKGEKYHVHDDDDVPTIDA